MKDIQSKLDPKNFARNLVDANEQLYYYALQLTEDRDDAKDLVQETNYKALKNYSRLQHEEHRNAWLYTILKNTHINNLRSGHSRNIRNSKSDQEIQIPLATMPDYENPDRIFERKELRERIRCLPPLYAKPLKLFLAGYAYKEIAHMTGVPIGTVKSRIHIAKDKLRRAYRSC